MIKTSSHPFPKGPAHPSLEHGGPQGGSRGPGGLWIPCISAHLIPASACPPHCRGPPPDQSPGWQSCQEHSPGGGGGGPGCSRGAGQAGLRGTESREGGGDGEVLQSRPEVSDGRRGLWRGTRPSSKPHFTGGARSLGAGPNLVPPPTLMVEGGKALHLWQIF